MTLEDAIKKLKEQQNEFNEHCIDYAGINEAYNMAIEALKQDHCEDAISRKDMLAVLRQSHSLTQALDGFEKLPSVTPKEKTGKWIEHPHECGLNWEFSMYECSNCHEWVENDYDYCPNCGVKMIEPQESEDDSKE